MADVSNRALSLLRTIDRLAPGKYEINLVKPSNNREDWIVSINISETIREVSIPARITLTHENRLNMEDGAQLTQKGGVVNPSVLP